MPDRRFPVRWGGIPPPVDMGRSMTRRTLGLGALAALLTVPVATTARAQQTERLDGPARHRASIALPGSPIVVAAWAVTAVCCTALVALWAALPSACAVAW